MRLQAAWYGLYNIAIPEDHERAEYWYGQAFEFGSTRALLNYGGLIALRGDLEAAEKVFERGAADNWGPALFWLAWCRTRRSSTRETWRKVRPLLERAAALGSPAAEYTLARSMIIGRFGLRYILRGLKLMLAFEKKAVVAMNAEPQPQ